MPNGSDAEAGIPRVQVFREMPHRRLTFGMRVPCATFGPFSLHRGSGDGIRVDGFEIQRSLLLEGRVRLGSWERFDARTNLLVRVSAQRLGRSFVDELPGRSD